jgi:hypothetical protein
MSPTRNVSIHWEGMEIVAYVIQKCESHQKPLLFLINKATERAGMYTGKSLSYIL